MSPIFPGVLASGISGHLAPAVTGSFDALATYTVGAGGVSSIVFAGIPTGYSHLQIRGVLNTSGPTNPTYGFNNDTNSSNYKGHHLWGTGSSALANDYFAFNYNPSSNYPSGFIMDILDYTSTTKNKTTKTLAGSDTNGGTSEIALWSGLWMNASSPINSVTFFGNGVNFTQYSTFTLYGVK